MSFARWRLAAFALIAAPGLAQAQEGTGCSGFRWCSSATARQLVRAGKPSLPNGGALPYDVGTTLELEPLKAAGLPKVAGAAAEVRLGSSPAILSYVRAGEAWRLSAHHVLGSVGRRA